MTPQNVRKTARTIRGGFEIVIDRASGRKAVCGPKDKKITAG